METVQGGRRRGGKGGDGPPTFESWELRKYQLNILLIKLVVCGVLLVLGENSLECTRMRLRVSMFSKFSGGPP